MSQYDGWQCCLCLQFHANDVPCCPNCVHYPKHPGASPTVRCKPARYKWECCDCDSPHNMDEDVCLKLCTNGKACGHREDRCCTKVWYEAHKEWWLCCLCFGYNNLSQRACQCGHRREHRTDKYPGWECWTGIDTWACPACKQENSMCQPSCTRIRENLVCGKTKDKNSTIQKFIESWVCTNPVCQKKKLHCNYGNLANCATCGWSRKDTCITYKIWRGPASGAFSSLTPRESEPSRDIKSKGLSNANRHFSMSHGQPKRERSRHQVQPGPSVAPSPSTSEDYKPLRSNRLRRSLGGSSLSYGQPTEGPVLHRYVQPQQVVEVEQHYSESYEQYGQGRIWAEDVRRGHGRFR